MSFLKAGNISPKFLKATPLSIAVTSGADGSLWIWNGRSQGETDVSLMLPGWCSKACKQVFGISFAVTFCIYASCYVLNKSSH